MKECEDEVFFLEELIIVGFHQLKKKRREKKKVEQAQTGIRWYLSSAPETQNPRRSRLLELLASKVSVRTVADLLSRQKLER